MKMILLLLFPLLFSATPTTYSPDSYIGKWTIEGGSIIEIYKKGNTFYGKIKKRADKPISNMNGLDNNNPNKKLRNRKLIGMNILENLKYHENELCGGTIYDADNGKYYTVKIWIDKENKNICYIRAYKSILFKTFTAKRVYSN